MAVAGAENSEAEAVLERLRSTEPPKYLSPSPELSRTAREASAQLYSALVALCPKGNAPPLDRLLTDDVFDAEQIWQQIDLLSRPLVSLVSRQLALIQRVPPATYMAPFVETKPWEEDVSVRGTQADRDDDDDEEEEDEEMEDVQDGDEEVDEEDDDDEDEEEDGQEDEEQGVEDKFLKIKELEDYLQKDEEREYGRKGKKAAAKRKEKRREDDDDEDEDDDEVGGPAGLEFEDLYGDGDDGEDMGDDARYEDFFESEKKGRGSKKDDGGKRIRSSEEVEFLDGSEDFSSDDDQEVDSEEEEEEEDEDNDNLHTQGKESLSTHEKQLLKMQSKIVQLEKANLEPKTWTMQGEVTAARRPKNSALEVDLDFEQNVRPPPVITEEVTASLEDLIRKRISEGRFDDVQKRRALPSKAPKERKELDENKSQKGLAELYEEEYTQKTGLAPAPMSASDEQKKEASILFKRICLKLDALSHFHFAPKPVIEDMSVQANVPALAMEEIAPLAVSDAAMLAPEEIFEGKGEIKEEAELTKVDRKRRRANNKRVYKKRKQAEDAKRQAGKASLSAANIDKGNEVS